MNADPRMFRPAAPDGLLDEQQAAALGRLAETLSPEQALWVSGYLAGLGAQASLPDEQPAAGAGAPRVTILYGSETGNAAGLARLAQQRAGEKGLEARIVDMADYRSRELKYETDLLIITSTHGEGDPPDPAVGFYEFVMGRKAPKLEGARFAVVALGDSTYEHFCQTGKDFDVRLEALGATRIHERVDCDVDFDVPAEAAIDALVDILSREVPADRRAEARAAVPTFAPFALPGAGTAARTARHDRKKPFEATIIESIVLNGRGSDKDTRHIELLIEGSGLAFEPGDSLGVVPRNDPDLVAELIEVLGFDAETPVANGKGDKSLADALLHDYEITTLTPTFLKGYAERTEDEELLELAGEGGHQALRRFMQTNQVLDVVGRYPANGMGAQDFAGLLRKLKPRLYSIASSQKVTPDEAHITVAPVRYALNGRARGGVASTHLADRLGIDDTVPVYVEPNRAFKLPADPSTPIIMIGAGTGVAPYRAFLQEREELGEVGPAWLIFGERRFRTDFLYQTEWQRHLKEGLLTRMDIAFSRDQEEKVYVQHRMLERARDLYAWLEDGAHLYVCGDAERMAPDVHDALIGIVERERGVAREAAAEYVAGLQRSRRYLRDVY